MDKGYAEQLQEDQLTLETFNETIQEMLKQSQVYHQAMEKSTELLSLDDFLWPASKKISVREKMTDDNKKKRQRMTKLQNCQPGKKRNKEYLEKKALEKAEEAETEETESEEAKEDEDLSEKKQLPSQRKNLKK